MSKKYLRLAGLSLGMIAILVFVRAISAQAATTTTDTTINYIEFADNKVMPWLDKITLFIVTFVKQVGVLFQQVFTEDFLNTGLKFLKGIWDFILGIFKLFIDLLTQSFKK
ncbi:MAG TPA: hypothetical protein PK547_01805 [Candidatus Paceibacterota bacterium]|nr:hypothetical protein [Candidatus Paceibacterota bacterium]